MPISLTTAFFLIQAVAAGGDESAAQPPVVEPEVLGVEVIRTYPHQTDAFTQGLLFDDGILIESTGLEGRSRLRKLSIRTGRPVQEVSFPSDVFAEGTALVGDKLITLTYKSGKAFVFDADTLEETGSFSYPGEGWGLTFDGQHLIMSDGTSELRFLDPDTFQEIRRVGVTLNGEPLRSINELEFIDGKVWANVFIQDYLVRIDPDTGIIDQVADLRSLFPRSEREAPYRDVLNGIAYEENSGRLFVTGKHWPNLFEIRLVPQQ
ncbi:MAG: glutaminyl-peptide cyclotransferase [Pseudomonadota bacterium]